MNKCFCLLSILMISSHMGFCADGDSGFIETTSDKQISGTIPVSVLSYTLVLTQAKNVLLVADGRYYPAGINGTAVVGIQIDGNGSYCNASVIEWNTSQNAVQHAFDCIGIVTLNAGTHVITLVAYNQQSTPTAGFVVGANSGLSIMTNPSPYFQNSTLGFDSQIINENTYGVGSYGNLPATTLLTNNVNVISQSNVFTLLSGRAYCAGGQGDAAWGIYLNNQCPANNSSNWAVNDIFSGAELHAPMFCYAMHNLVGNNSISFNATELSYDAGYPADLVEYRVGQEVRMISLWGMPLSGSAINSNLACDRVDWRCIGSSNGYGSCSPAGTNSLITQTTINIPNGHNGIVFFKAEARLQGDPGDIGGTAAIWINIDGVDVGAVGLQQLKTPNCVSERTISASYLSSGNSKLSPGQHTVSVYARADGNFIHLNTTNELPLIYFD